jgi:hypothetical protein
VKFAQDVFGAEEAARFDVAFGLAERIVQGGTIGVIKPIAGIQGKKLELRAIWQICRLIDNQPTAPNACLERHEDSLLGRETPANPRRPPAAVPLCS